MATFSDLKLKNSWEGLEWLPIAALLYLTGLREQDARAKLKRACIESQSDAEDGRLLLWRTRPALRALLAPESDPNDPTAQRARKDRLQGDLLELDYKERIKALVPREQITSEVAETFSILRDNLIGLSSELAKELVNKKTPEEIRDTLQQEITNKLTETSLIVEDLFSTKYGKSEDVVG